MAGNYTLKVDEAAVARLGYDKAVAEQLRPAADKILSRARAKAPSWLDAEWFVRHGVSRRGAFAQAIARGSGALLAEYGGARSPAHAYMRSSVR